MRDLICYVIMRLELRYESKRRRWQNLGQKPEEREDKTSKNFYTNFNLNGGLGLGVDFTEC